MTRLFFIGTLLLSSFLGATQSPPETVPYVDLKQYMGTWFEIARFPFSQQEGCHNTTATYRLETDGTVGITNRCRKGSFEGALSVAQARGRVVDNKTNAKLKVKFFWLAPWSDYWVIDLGKEYEYAVVSQPSRKYLWVLSRTPNMPDTVYAEILQRLENQSFETEKLIRTPQQWSFL